MVLPKSKRKVNFFLVGAAKCGTTSMWHYLYQHPDIYLPENKQEMHFFATHYQKLPHAEKKAYGLHDSKLIHSIEEYELYYQNVANEKIIADISPEYMYYYKCAKDIKKYNSDAKILFLLRNPVDRAYSAYMHLRKDLSESMNFREAFMESKHRVNEQNYNSLYDLQGWSYAPAIEYFITCFGAKKVMVILFEEFVRDTQQIMDQICDFLEISRFEFDVSKKYNESGIPKDKWKASVFLFFQTNFIWAKKLLGAKVTRHVEDIMSRLFIKGNLWKQPMTKEDREFVYSYYGNEINRLEKLLGRSLNIWKM